MGQVHGRRKLPRRGDLAVLRTLGIGFLMLLAAAAQAFPQNATKPGTPPSAKQATPTKKPAKAVSPAVFIDSNPIGAVVVLDGRTIPARTPLLLRGLAAGRHSVAIARAGYTPDYGSIEARANRPAAFTFDLRPKYFEPLFPPGTKVLIDGKRADYATRRYHLPPGEYEVGSSNGVVSIAPVFPAQQIMRITDIAAGGLLAASAILLGEAILNSKLGSTSPNAGSSPNLSSSVPIWVITGASTLSDIFLHIQKARFMKAYSPISVSRASSATDARRLYEKGQRLLAAGNLSGANDEYIQVVRDHSDSPYFPRALYQLAKIDAVEGDNLLATAELHLLLTKYPVADLYDKTCKSLADISYRAGDYRQAIDYLDKMVYIDPLYTRREIAQYRSLIERKLARKGTRS